MKTDINLPISAIERSPTNPRQRYDDEGLRKLADTIKAQGVLQRLLVRPWPGRPGVYECVDGERRLRSATALGLARVPVDIREMTTAEVIAVQLVTGETGEPLSPIEEARGIANALELKDDAGEAVYDVDRLSEKIGCSKNAIYWKLSLLKLPDSVVKLVESGQLSVATAQLLTRIPDDADRAEAAVAIMPDGMRAEPLSFRAAEALIRERWTISLRSAPFSLEAVMAGPGGQMTSCRACPHFDESGGRKLPMCTRPRCFRERCQSVWDVAAAAARAKGRAVLSDAEAEKVFDSMAEGVEVRPDSEYVDLNTKPSYRHVSSAVEDKSLPTWKSLLADAKDKGIEVPVIEARHARTGRVVELVKLNLAIEAAKKAGEDIFRKDSVSQVVRHTDQYAENKKEEHAAAKRRFIESATGLALLHARLAEQPASEAVMKALLETALHHAGPDGRALVMKAFSIVPEASQSESMALLEWFSTTGGPEALALVPVLLVSHDMKWNGLQAAGYAALAALVGLSAEEVESLADPKPVKKKKPKTPKLTLADQEKVIRERAAAGKALTEIYLETHVPRRTIKTVLKKIEAEKGAAA